MGAINNSLLFLFVVTLTLTEKTDIVCPPKCECDMFENLRRATCIDKNFVSVQAFIPNVTQILDMSYNQIRELPDHVFYDESLLSLQLLNLSHNKVNQIHINAFYGMDSLKSIDLSYNALQYILPHWFWNLESLQELYLSENAFRALGDGPLFECNSLRVLDMSQSSISLLESDAFIKLPNLEYLDLSGNNLLQLDVTVINPMKKLKFLNVTHNNFDCDMITNLTQYCFEHDIEYTDHCKKSNTNETKMFEKMVISTPVPNVTKNSWIYDSEKEMKHNQNKILSCPNSTNERQNNNESLLTEIIELSPELAVIFVFVFGILIGLIVGCSVQIGGSKPEDYGLPTPKDVSRRSRTANKLRRNTYFKSTLSLKSRRNYDEEDGQTLVMSAFEFPESSPLCTRKWQE